MGRSFGRSGGTRSWREGTGDDVFNLISLCCFGAPRRILWFMNINSGRDCSGKGKGREKEGKCEEKEKGKRKKEKGKRKKEKGKREKGKKEKERKKETF